MDYLNSYRKIVTKQNEETLLQILKDTGHWAKLRAINFTIIDDTILPYILTTVDYQESDSGYFAGVMIGISLEQSCIRTLDTTYSYKYFYLPLVAKPCAYPEIAKAYYSEEQAIRHELRHIADMLHWINDEPEYLDNVLRYSYEAATEETLQHSIDFEVKKIFRLEPQALQDDHESGEDMLIEPFIFGRYMKYRCTTQQEYLEIKLSDYVSDLKEMYVKNYPQKKGDIEHFFEKSVGQYGEHIFGESPYAALRHVRKDKIQKMLAYSIEAVKQSE